MSEREIFSRAIKLSGTAREAYVRDACRGDEVLRRQVEALLQAHDQSQDLVLQPASDAPDATRSEMPDSAAGTLVAGRYKLLEPIGEGGMGSVWLAEQKEPVKRKVALKLIKPGMDSRAVLARFEAERQALAVMDHPNIAKVYDGGMTGEGRPYFVMELVRGIPLTDYCDQVQLSVRERLELFAQVCSAVQHAHQKGIIHRDLKPSNILVTEHDGKPVCKVIDFGLAKAMHGAHALTDASLHTAFGSVVGTPLYMAPEQLGVSALDVDTRADLYSLGVILYELLTGSTPIEKERLKQAAWDEICRLVCEEDPPKPSIRLSSNDTLSAVAARRHVEPAKLSRMVRGDLDWIVMKALDKSRSRRYQSAAEFSRDVACYLDGDMVSARPPSFGYKMARYVRKNKGLVVSVTSILVLGLSAIIGTSWGMFRAFHLAKQRDQFADKAEEKAKESDRNAALHELAAREARTALETIESNLAGTSYFYQMALARWESNRKQEAIDYLERTPERYRRFEWYMARNEFEGELPGHWPGDANSWDISPDGGRLVVGSHEGTRLLDLDSPVPSWKRDGLGPVRSARFCCGGSRVVSELMNGQVQLLDAANGELIWPGAPTDDSTAFYSVTLTAEGPVRLWKLANNQLFVSELTAEGKLTKDVQRVMLPANKSNQFATKRGDFAISQDGNLVAMWHEPKSESNGNGKITLHNVLENREVWAAASGSLPPELAFSPLNALLLVDGFDKVAAYEVTNGNLRYWIADCDDAASIVFSPDLSRLVCQIGKDELAKLKLLNARSGESIGVLRLRGTESQPLFAFTPDGTHLFGQGESGTVDIWDARTALKTGSIKGAGTVKSFSFAPDGSRMSTGGGFVRDITRFDGCVELQVDQRFEDPKCLAINRPGTRIVTQGVNQGYRHSVAVWDTATGAEVWERCGNQPGSSTDDRTLVARFSPDGTRLVSIDNSGTAILWDAGTGELLTSISPVVVGPPDCCLAFTIDGSRLAIRRDEETVAIFETAAGKELQSVSEKKKSFQGVAFHPGCRSLVTIDFDGILDQWDLESGKKVTSLRAFDLDQGAGMANCELRFTPDESRVVVGGYGGNVVCFDLESGNVLWNCKMPSVHLFSRNWCLSPDGDLLAFSLHGQIRLVDVRTGALVREIGKVISGAFPESEFLSFNSDSSRLLAGHERSNVLTLWDVSAGEELRRLSGMPTGIQRAHFCENDVAIVAAGSSFVRRWDASRQPRGEGQQAHAILESQFEVKDWWHRKQVVQAKLEENWYAACFHLNWLARTNPLDSTTLSELKTAIERMSRQDRNIALDKDPLIRQILDRQLVSTEWIGYLTVNAGLLAKFPLYRALSVTLAEKQPLLQQTQNAQEDRILKERFVMQLNDWRNDPQFSDFRDPEALAKLSEAEQGVLRDFWKSIDAIAFNAALNLPKKQDEQ